MIFDSFDINTIVFKSTSIIEKRKKQNDIWYIIKISTVS